MIPSLKCGLRLSLSCSFPRWRTPPLVCRGRVMMDLSSGFLTYPILSTCATRDCRSHDGPHKLQSLPSEIDADLRYTPAPKIQGVAVHKPYVGDLSASTVRTLLDVRTYGIGSRGRKELHRRSECFVGRSWRTPFQLENMWVLKT